MTASNTGSGSDKNNAKEERKLRKPLIEKRRRERINCSLEQLKGIMVDAYSLDQSKLEKADVLEITVQHMEGLQKSHIAGSPNASSAPGFESRQRYSSGYIQCVHEVHNLLLSCPGMDKSLGARLLNHLLQSLPRVGADSPTGGCSPTNSSGHFGSRRANERVGAEAVNCNSAVDTSGRGDAHLRNGSLVAASPPGSPLSPPARTPIRPRRLVLPAAPRTAHPPGAGEGGAEEREGALSASSSVPPPNLPPPPPAAPLSMSHGGSFMWRPW